MEWSCLGFGFDVVWKAADDKSEELTPIRWLIVLPPEIWSSIYQEATSPCYNPLPVIPSMVDTEIDTLTRKKPGAQKIPSILQFTSTGIWIIIYFTFLRLKWENQKHLLLFLDNCSLTLRGLLICRLLPVITPAPFATLAQITKLNTLVYTLHIAYLIIV